MSLATRNVEPIAGYTLRERIGSGGYGEVWKADAPGGLAKAIKLVYGYADGDRATRELKAMSLIKTLRHPFLLSLERIEVIDGQLMIVTELADCSLKDCFERRRAEGLRGIPRHELLQFMRDAADALDYMNEQHSLQHLDVKPENLLLVGDHVKVADFGLVKDVQQQSASLAGGLTPVYASPELFAGGASRRSDQYSLAIVYQEMLTGVLPFPGKTAAQLAAQHINAKPLLFSLPPGERKVIGRALAKDPSQRFANCRELVEYLQSEAMQATLPSPESWFSKSGPPAEKIEPVNSTLCLNTARFSTPIPAEVPSEQPAAVHSAEDGPSYEVSHEELRSSGNMFADMDRAERHIDEEFSSTTEFSATCVMRRSREPKLTCVDAPIPAGPAVLRPTLVLGVGRVGGIVLQRLKQRISDRYGKVGACPAIQFLYLDADPQGVQSVVRGDVGAALDPQDVMHLGLRKSQDYRAEGPALLQWLSRRWLYNIPRSLTPEGLRPLGRLAFADRAREVRDRIRKSLQSAVEQDARQTTQDATSFPFEGPPRVIVLGAICGGTAGGMMLDICFLARQLLERMGNAQRDVLGLMMHYRGRQAAAHELALVNSYATLAELEYYSRPEKPYPGDPSCGLEPRKEDHAPMRDGYFVHLGDFLTDAELVSAADKIAEYVYLDCVSAVSPALNACRELRAEPAEAGLKLRSFGLSKVGFTSGDLIPWASMTLCHDLLQQWLGEGLKITAEIEVAVEEATKTQLQSHDLEFDRLLQQLVEEFGKHLPCDIEAWSKDLLACESKPLSPASLPKLDFNVVIHSLSQVLGERTDEGIGLEAKYPDTVKTLSATVEGKARQCSEQLANWIRSQPQSLGYRLFRTERAASSVMRHLGSLQDHARNQRKKLQEGLAHLEAVLGAGAASGSRLPAIRKSVQEYEARFEEYLRLRMINVAMFLVQDLARRIRNLLSAVSDQLQDARREMKGLLTEMTPGTLAEPLDSSAEAQLHKSLSNEFAARRNSLIEQLDEALQSAVFQPGFLPVIARGGEQRQQFIDEFFHLSRNTVQSSLSGLDIANFLLEPEANRFAPMLDAAQPKPLADGNCRMLVALSESSADTPRCELIQAAVRKHTSALPAVVPYQESDVTVVSELSDLSTAEIAVRLIDERADFIEYARRVFSRGDIPFEPLAVREDE